MGLGDWLRKAFGGRQPPQEMVPFLDAEAGRVVRIPASELRPGAIQVRLQGTDEVVWALPEQLHQGEVKHPEFEEGIRDYIRQIQAAFAEHRPLSFEEWEEGFRRDANPEREIAIWSHAADIYTAFAANEPRRPPAGCISVHRDVHDHRPRCGLAGSAARVAEPGGGRAGGQPVLRQADLPVN